MSYFRAIDPFPLQSPDDTKLHEFYGRLAAGKLSTTVCTGCGYTAWPPRGLCPECASDALEWIDLPETGTIHAFSVQETGLPAGFAGPRTFAIVKIRGLRIFSIVTGEPSAVRIGQRVRLTPIKIADDPKGLPRWLPAFTPDESGADVCTRAARAHDTTGRDASGRRASGGDENRGDDSARDASASAARS